ncbi:T9SS type A sorting domain-containing protein, partial [Winogradskyella sp.]|nr:T9SS type A sorting domain-containing protein [Winogradskyella sp.]
GSAGRLTFDQNATTNNTLSNSFFTFLANEFEQIDQVTVNFDGKSNNSTSTVGIQIAHSLGGGAVNNQFNGNETLTVSWAPYSIIRSLSADFDEIRVGLRVKTNVANASLGDTFDFDNVSVIVDYFNLAPPAPAGIASAQDGAWDDTATWVEGVVPTSSDNVIIDHIITVNGDVSANNLTISAGQQVLVNKGNSITVLGDLVTDSGAENSLILRGDSDQFSSLIVNGTSTGEVRFRRYVNDNEATAGNDLIASPVVITSFNDFYGDNASFFVEDPGSNAVLFGPFDNSANPGVYVNWDFSATNELTPGVGYRMGTNGTLDVTSALNFHGQVTTTDVNVTITEEVGGFGEWNLIGNPYPSYITLADFLTENNAEFAASSSGVYGYDGDASDGWQVWNLAYSAANSGALISPGQGFFVASKTGGGSVDFKTAMRAIGATDDFILGRNSETSHLGNFEILLSNSNDESYKSSFYFNTNATTALDPGYDSKMYGETIPNFSIYSELVENNVGEAMLVQSFGASEISNVVIPIGINAAQGEQLTISIFNVDMPASVEVYLEDTLENTFTLLNDSDFTITPTTNLSGTGRFYLRISEDALSLVDNPLDTIQIYALNDLLVVNGNVKTNTVLNLYDLQGRLVISKILDASQVNQSIDVSNATTGVYVVVLEGQGYLETKKVIIN